MHDRVSECSNVPARVSTTVTGRATSDYDCLRQAGLPAWSFSVYSQCLAQFQALRTLGWSLMDGINEAAG